MARRRPRSSSSPRSSPPSSPSGAIYAIDPGDMNTRMHQEAFPGEDISDRSDPEERVPALLALIEGDLPSGRYSAGELLEARA